MNRSRTCWLLVIGSVLLWLFLVLPAYYVVHKPLSGGLGAVSLTMTPSAQNIATALLSNLADLTLLALTLIAVAAWGSRIGRWLGLTFDPGLERWTLGAILGLGLLGTVILGLAAVGALYRWVGYAILLLVGLTALPEIRALFRWLAAVPRQPRRPGVPWAWIYTALICLFSLGMALLPPTSWDALVYHLQGPRLYVEANRLVAVPENLYLNWPAQVEMLFTWGLLLKGDTLAKLFHWVFWPLTTALLYSLARRTMDPGAGRWAVVLWASVPFVVELAGWAYVDLGLTAFVLGGVYAFFRWIERPRDGWLVLSAIFLGLAMATKYTAATWLGLLILLFAYHALRHQRRSIGWTVTRVVGIGLIGGLLVIPWLVKNWFITGNPIYPFLFGGLGWNDTRHTFLTGTGGGYSRNPLDYLALPWLATIVGTSGTAAFDATTGPLLLCLVPMVFLFRGRPRAVNYGLVLVAGQMVYFVAMIYRYVYLVETRLLLPVFPFLCLAASYTLRKLPAWDRPALRLSWLVRSIVVLVLAVNLLTETLVFLSVRPFAPLLGLESRRGYLTRRLGAHFAVMQQTNEQLRRNDRALYFLEPRGYYASRQDWTDATLDNLAQLYLAYDDVDEALSTMQARSISHLLVYRTGVQFLLGPTPRPPTLSSLMGSSPPERSHYPITADHLDFLEALLDRCQKVGDVGESYELYQLP